jgi:hypothetical protein
MRSMIERIDDEGYAAPPPGRPSGGIGGHVRHCLDHVRALVTATRTGFCAYDRRERGTSVEVCRAAALRVIGNLEEQIARLGAADLELPLEVETQLDAGGAMLVTSSSVGRELVFVTSHTIHHNAIVAHLLQSRGDDMGVRFGLAPATPLPDDRLACAQ